MEMRQPPNVFALLKSRLKNTLHLFFESCYLPKSDELFLPQNSSDSFMSVYFWNFRAKIPFAKKHYISVKTLKEHLRRNSFE